MNKTDCDIVFLGGLFPEETKTEIINNSVGLIDNAANNLQWNLVRGLDCNLKCPVKIINSLHIGSFPKRYKKLIIPDYDFNHYSNVKDINVGFLNLSLYKHFSRIISVRPHLKEWALSTNNKPKIIIAYALTNVFTDLLRYVKITFPDIITIIVVPDLPEYMNTTNNAGVTYKMLKMLSVRHIMSCIHYIDGFVLLTKQMAVPLGINSVKTVVIEGVSESIEKRPVSGNIFDSDIISIVYTGTLHERYGILNLLKAFMLIDNSNYRLVLCGAGDSEKKIFEMVKFDDRIIFKGQLMKNEIIDIQKNATVLVNPRQNNEEFTKYSFPSKNMEYLSSGRPLIAYKLDGIPDEYDAYTYYVQDNSIEALSNKIVEVCSCTHEYLTCFGAAARDWVIKEKNCVVQAKKIIDMISEM
ncbi:MAG: glycosyltransferase [Chlorobiaceae bacterium]|nr:glycosyltransferase [Chlorobiaceae bacterium]NTV17774.1 glycosyltransferase [Chlorobiaceae bacterium]